MVRFISTLLTLFLVIGCNNLGIDKIPCGKKIEVFCDPCIIPDHSENYNKVLIALEKQNERISEQNEVLNTFMQLNTEQLEDVVLHLSNKIDLMDERINHE